MRNMDEDIKSLLLLFGLCLGLFFALFLHEQLYLFLAVWNQFHASHERLKHLGYSHTLLGLIVLHDATHRALCRAESCVEHVCVYFFLGD